MPLPVYPDTGLSDSFFRPKRNHKQVKILEAFK